MTVLESTTKNQTFNSLKKKSGPAAVKTFVIDLFCGAGGTSTAIHKSNSNIEVIACINHDKNAIISHSENYPNCIHYTEDIRYVSLRGLQRIVRKLRLENPGCKIAIWASLECTHFSKAKGGQSRNEDSRTLAEHLFRYDEILKPDFIWIENVREFLTWGPLDEEGKPIKEFKGRDYDKWVQDFKDRGYYYDYRLLNAADFGAFTSRLRYFGQFSKNPNLLSFPKATHHKKAKDGLKKWMPVKKVLDLTNEGLSIFNRKKRLSDATLERIYSGLIKFVANGDTSFIKKYFSGNPDGLVSNISDPCGTLLTKDSHALINAVRMNSKEDGSFIKRYNGGDPDEKVKSLNDPIGTISTNGRHAIVRPVFLQNFYTNGSILDPESVCGTLTTKDSHAIVKPIFMLSSYYGTPTHIGENDPCGTLTTKDRFSKIDVHFIQNYYSSGGELNSVDEPNPALTTIPKQRVATVNFIDNQYGNSSATSMENPLGTVTANPKQNVVTANPWIMDTQFGNVGSSIEDPSRTIVANRKYTYLMNPQFVSKGSSLENPCFTLIARMDKAPPYMITTEEGSVEWALDLTLFFDESDMQHVYDELSDTYGPRLEKSVRVRIIEFMIVYQIRDIKMRMLEIIEMLQIQGFPKDYKLVGTKTEQKKYIGNSVEVTVGVALFEDIDNKIQLFGKWPWAA